MKAGWEVRALGEVCAKIGSGATPRGGNDSYKDAGISLIRSLNVHDLEFRLKDLARIDDEQAQALANVEVSVGDVLLNITGASVARCCVVPIDLLPARVNQHVSILRPKPQMLSTEFLAYLLVSKEMKDKLLGIGDDGGSTRQALTKAQLQEFPIPLPPPDEQKRIVAVLDAAFEGLTRARAHTETNLQNARELFEGGVDGLFQADLANWKSGPLGKLVGVVSTGPFGSVLHKADYVDGETPIVNPAHIVDGRIEPDSRKTIGDEAKQRLKSYLLRKGDIVLGRRGEMGRCAAVGEKEDGWLCGTGSFFIRPNGNANSDFVAHLLRSRTYVERLEGIAGGATMPNISNKDLAELEVQLPALALQDAYLLKIDALRSDCDSLQSHYRTKLADLDDLRQSLLQKAFAGELT